MTELLITLPIALMMMVMFLLYLYSIFWAYGDAQDRGKPGCLVALVVALLSWPLGLILWVVLRPERPWRRYY